MKHIIVNDDNKRNMKGGDNMKINISRLNLAMANACMSINDLAEKSEVSRVSIGRFLNGKTEPKPVTVGKLAKALNVKVEYLIESEE